MRWKIFKNTNGNSIDLFFFAAKSMGDYSKDLDDIEYCDVYINNVKVDGVQFFMNDFKYIDVFLDNLELLLTSPRAGYD